MDPNSLQERHEHSGLVEQRMPFTRHGIVLCRNMSKDEDFEIRKTQGGSLLFPDDQLVDILDENDFVHVGRYNYNVGIDSKIRCNE